jgi:hypothetical protein
VSTDAAPASNDAASPLEGASPPGSAPAGQPAGDQPHRRRRRRRRRGPRPEGAPQPGVAADAPASEASAGDGQTAEAVSADSLQPATAPAGPHEGRPGRGPRHRRGRGRRDFRPRERQGEGGAPAEGGAPERAPRDRDHDRPRRGPRDRDERRGKGKGDRDRRDRGKRPFGKGRDDFRKKPEPKLYSFESVVDRGFEDVADPANEGATRRAEWTIVKRTVADQKAARTVSAVYVLKRDGADTEFANLAAARTAVNKTIVHPEKLTRAKADYPSTKK